MSLGEQALKRLKVPFSVHEYDFRIKGADKAAAALGIPLPTAIKSLVVALPEKRFAFLLMSGDTSVSMKGLARTLGVKSVDMAPERDAERLTGYRVGGISPFGSRTPLPVFVDKKVMDRDKVYVNGGRRGLLIGIAPEDLVRASRAEIIDVSIRPRAED